VNREDVMGIGYLLAVMFIGLPILGLVMVLWMDFTVGRFLDWWWDWRDHKKAERIAEQLRTG
jgi:hypothetical protein